MEVGFILLVISNLRVKCGALRVTDSALRAPKLPAGCTVEHFFQTIFERTFASLWAQADGTGEPYHIG